MKELKFVFVLGCLIFSSFVLLTLVVGLLISIFFSNDSDLGVKKKHITHFRYFKYDPETKRSSFGFMDSTDFGGDGLYYQEESTGSHVLVTPFGSPNHDYKCSGTCTCDHSSRRVSGALSRPLIVLISALSSSFAVHLAKNRFEESCRNQLDSDCDTGRSEVDHCIRAEHIDEPDEDYSHHFVEDPVGEKTSEEKYKCKGHCYPKDYYQVVNNPEELQGVDDSYVAILKHNVNSLQEKVHDYQCKSKVLEKEISMNAELVSPDGKPSGVKDVSFGIPKEMEGEEGMKFEMFSVPIQLVRDKFALDELHPYCTFTSRQEVELENAWGSNVVIQMQHCAGFDEKGNNNNVECVPYRETLN